MHTNEDISICNKKKNETKINRKGCPVEGDVKAGAVTAWQEQLVSAATLRPADRWLLLQL